jgi:hypothetical protein
VCKSIHGCYDENYSCIFPGVEAYMKLTSSKKLILGLPWYGYNYQCIKYNTVGLELKEGL